jgi:hypothetical protein
MLEESCETAKLVIVPLQGPSVIDVTSRGQPASDHPVETAISNNQRDIFPHALGLHGISGFQDTLHGIVAGEYCL